MHASSACPGDDGVAKILQNIAAARCDHDDSRGPFDARITAITPPVVGELSTVMSMSVCLCVCPRAYLQNCRSDLHQIVCGCYLVAVWLGPSPPVCDTLCTSGFMDDGMLEHNGFFCVAYS